MASIRAAILRVLPGLVIQFIGPFLSSTISASFGVRLLQRLRSFQSLVETQSFSLNAFGRLKSFQLKKSSNLDVLIWKVLRCAFLNPEVIFSNSVKGSKHLARLKMMRTAKHQAGPQTDKRSTKISSKIAGRVPFLPAYRPTSPFFSSPLYMPCVPNARISSPHSPACS